MASRKKEMTGISLLSMYDDEDEEMEDAEAGEQEEANNDESLFDNLDSVIREEDKADEESIKKPRTDEGMMESDHTPKQAQVPVSTEQLNNQKASLYIVDYGHDEVAMSPEAAEEREMHAAGRDNVDLQNANVDPQQRNGNEASNDRSLGHQAPSTGLSDQLQTAQIGSKDEDVSESHCREGMVSKTDEEAVKDVDPVDRFLPPPPVEKCSQELQDKINKFLALKKSGKSFNREVRNKKAYRNPNFLLHAVTYQDIDQIGSCFNKDVFDPHGYDQSDYYDEIEADVKRELERKEQERKKSQKVEFVVGGTQPGMVTTALKPALPSPVTNLAVGGASALDAVPREGRSNKKSKWDKVDDDQGSKFAGGQDSKTSLIGAYASLSSAHAGTGYTAFAQQRRREAEEKKSSERRRSKS